MDLVELFGGIVKGVRVLGMALVGLAALCALAPVGTGAAVILLLGLVLLAAGLLRGAFGWRALRAGRGPMGFVVGLLTGLFGFFLALHPVAALGPATSLVALYLLLDGLAGAVFGFQMRPEDGWSEAFVEGMLSILLAASIWKGWPVAGERAIGLVLAAKLTASGALVLRLQHNIARAEARVLGLREQVARRVRAGRQPLA
jgi:uncharacterized membrane protein HdeD (DUF308 family)